MPDLSWESIDAFLLMTLAIIHGAGQLGMYLYELGKGAFNLHQNIRRKRLLTHPQSYDVRTGRYSRED